MTPLSDWWAKAARGAHFVHPRTFQKRCRRESSPAAHFRSATALQGADDELACFSRFTARAR